MTKRIYRIDLRDRERGGFVKKSLVVDLLKIANPDEHRRRGSPGAYGVGRGVLLPVPVGGDRGAAGPERTLLVASDNNYPGNAARYPGTPDDTEMIVIDLRKIRGRRPRCRW